MRKSCFILSVIGFFMGMIIGNLIAWFSSGTLINVKLVGWTGSAAAAVAIQTLLSGLLCAVAMGGVVVHELERWSILRCAIVHFMMIEIVYTPIALTLGWVESPKQLLISLGIQFVVYCMIWLIMFLHYKAKVQTLRKLLRKGNSEPENECPFESS